jgi:ABC-type lipoprotein release transport system permease subunit
LGIAIGLGIAAFVTRFLAGFLYQTSPLDPVTFAAVTALFAGCACIAALAPAIRATLVDPVVALRYE